VSLPQLVRTLGRTGLSISRIGLGTWAIGGGGPQGGWGRQEDAESIRAIHRAVELGVNWIDTAPAYGLGRSEEVVGRALRELPERDRPLVFTKCGLIWPDGATKFSNVLAPASIRAECESSLRRLGLERLDLLQIHWPSHDGTPIEESWQTMAELVTEGKVGAIGVSNFDLELLERCQAVRHVDTLQPELSLFVRGAAELFPWCAAHGTGIIAYSPLRSGLLSGRFTTQRAQSLPPDDWRSTHPDFTGSGLERSLELVRALEPIAGAAGYSIPELAIAWTLAWPEVDGAIVGARGADQVDAWIRALDIELGQDELRSIAALLDELDVGSGPTRPGSPAHARASVTRTIESHA
jgi:aryl-alcohol dehydrogenase-like predicted oxidoreductase